MHKDTGRGGQGHLRGAAAPCKTSLGSGETEGQMANDQQETGKLVTISYPVTVRVQQLKEKHSFIIFRLGLIQ